MYKLALPLLAVFVISPARDQSSVVDEVTQEIISSFERTRGTLKTQSSDYSSKGALEFWSSGGLLQEVGPNDRADTYESFTCVPKHIQVIPLGDEVAVAHYYSEGAMQPKGSPAVPHYMTRATQVFVKGRFRVSCG